MELRVGKIFLLIICGLFLFNLVEAGLYYEVGLDFDGESVSVSSVDVVYSRFDYVSPSGSDLRSYNLSLISSEGEVVYSENIGIMDFDFVENLTSDGSSSNEIVRLSKFNRTVYLPYTSGVSFVSVSNSEGEILSEGSLELFNPKNISEVDVFDSADSVSVNNNFLFYFIVIIFILILVSVIVYFTVFKNHEKKK